MKRTVFSIILRTDKIQQNKKVVVLQLAKTTFFIGPTAKRESPPEKKTFIPYNMFCQVLTSATCIQTIVVTVVKSQNNKNYTVLKLKLESFKMYEKQTLNESLKSLHKKVLYRLRFPKNWRNHSLQQQNSK